jgi:hypothetical protein
MHAPDSELDQQPMGYLGAAASPQQPRPAKPLCVVGTAFTGGRTRWKQYRNRVKRWKGAGAKRAKHRALVRQPQLRGCADVPTSEGTFCCSATPMYTAWKCGGLQLPRMAGWLGRWMDELHEHILSRTDGKARYAHFHPFHQSGVMLRVHGFVCLTWYPCNPYLIQPCVLHNVVYTCLVRDVACSLHPS